MKLSKNDSFMQKRKRTKMTTLIEKQLENCPTVYITDEKLGTILNVNAAQRYGQVKRALHKV